MEREQLGIIKGFESKVAFYQLLRGDREQAKMWGEHSTERQCKGPGVLTYFNVFSRTGKEVKRPE